MAETGRDDDDATAGELALGLLEGEARTTALRRMIDEPGFAAAVERWQARLGPLFERVPAVAPSELSWTRIARRIADPQALARTLRRWRAATFAAGAVAAALATVLVTRPIPAPVTIAAPAQVVLLTQLSDKAGEPLLAARYDPASGQLRVGTLNLPAGTRVPELWVLGPDGKPRSLGLVARNAAGDVVPAGALAPLLVAGSTFALTLEPAAGAPHAAPSGTILGTGKLVRL